MFDLPEHRNRSAEKSLEGFVAVALPQLLDSFLLDLPHSFAGHPEYFADLLQSHRLSVVEPVVKAQDSGLSILDRAEHFLDRIAQLFLENALYRPGCLFIGNRVEENDIILRIAESLYE